VQERMKYDAFGKISWMDAVFATKANSGYAWNRTFTGQVLDSGFGLMLYRNRYYHTGMGRFVTRDPIGYDAEDSSLYRYVASNPVVYCDPSGFAQLGFKTVTPPERKNCGAMAIPGWVIKWILYGKLEKGSIGGGIIQHITISIDVKNCDGMPAVTSLVEYWEAWRVFKNGNISDYSKDIFHSAYSRECTTGTVTFTGTAEFYEGLRWPGDFKVDKSKSSPAKGLHMTWTNPGELPGGTGSVTRKMTITWDCCSKDHGKESKITWEPKTFNPTATK